LKILLKLKIKLSLNQVGQTKVKQDTEYATHNLLL